MTNDFKTIFEKKYTWLEGYMRNVRRYPDKPAMISPERDKTWTYYDLNADSNALANTMAADCVGKGDVIMLQLLNCPEFVFSYIAAHKLGAVNCPVNFRLSPGELAFNLQDSKPKVFLFEDAHRKDVLEAVAIAGYSPNRLIVIDGESSGDVISYTDYVKGGCTGDPAAEGFNIYDETVRLYTSGTTGKPKAVPLTSINEVLSAHDVMMHFPMSYRDITMNTTPWFHRGGLHCAGPCPTFYAGATLVIMSNFDAKTTLKFVSKYKISFIIGVPTVLERLADEQEKQGYDLSSLCGIVTMGSPLERSACIRYQKVLTPNIFNGYGTTETFWNTFLRPFNLPDYAGTAGISCVDDDVRVVKVYEDRRAEPEDLAAQDDTEVGEVIISSVAKSPYRYVNNEAADKMKYYKDFFYTGDLATWDGNGFISIKSRKDDMIISSGENIYPIEVEEVLNKHPKVKDCMVTAAPDKMRGQLVTAYVIRSDDSLTPEELDLFCKESPDIANFKRPRYYRFIQNLPMNATGKKLHMKMKEMAADDLKNGLLYQV